MTSGRIIDLAVDPRDPRTWFVAAVSGGVWKTTNAGTTFTPIFDDQKSFSIGCVTIDPHDSLVVWVGSGENNSQRSVSMGDGVYKSVDGGKSWKNVGLGKVGAHRQDRRRSARLERRLRRGAGTALGAGRRPRPVQDHRRRQDVEGGADDQREHRRHRHRARSVEPRHAVRGVVSAPAPRLHAHRRRPGVGDLQIDRRRRDVDEAREERPAERADGPHRPGLSERTIRTSSTRRSNRRARRAASSARRTAARTGRRSTTTPRRARSTTARSSSIRTTTTASTPPTSGFASPATAARPGRSSTRRGSIPTTTSSGSIRRTAIICSSAATAGCTRRSTAPRRGTSRPTFPSRSSTA